MEAVVKILMLTSEVHPFAKTGGLADAVPAMAAALRGMGHDVRIVMPRYYGIDPQGLTQEEGPLGVPMGGGEFWCGLYSGTLPGTDVPVYFLDREDFYGRDGLYGPDGSSSWGDNALRFALLSTASFQICRKLGWFPDIFHLHDWQAAPAAWLLESFERRRGFEHTAAVLTVHNLGYQGQFAGEEAARFPAPALAGRRPVPVEWAEGLDGGINFLAAGLAHAQRITTVSPTYAREILTPDYSEGLGTLLNARRDRIEGILNGMDYDDWNPASDPALGDDTFSRLRMAGKKRLKSRLQKDMNLPVQPDIPVFGMVTRLTGQKGVDLLTEPDSPALAAFREGRAQLVILGTGEGRYETALKSVAKSLPASCAVKIAFSGPVSRLIEGGADFFLMPSRYEPCGLNQMYSLRYGTLPVVRRTGGLADSVLDMDEHPKSGDGFVFNESSSGDLGGAVDRAVKFYRRPRKMAAARKRAMGRRFDWDLSAKGYLEVYRKALDDLN